MQSISVAQAKNQLPYFLHMVEQGEQIEITRHGKAIAYLSDSTGEKPIHSAFEMAYKQFRNRLETEGLTENEMNTIFDIPRTQEPPLRHPEDFE